MQQLWTVTVGKLTVDNLVCTFICVYVYADLIYDCKETNSFSGMCVVFLHLDDVTFYSSFSVGKYHPTTPLHTRTPPT